MNKVLLLLGVFLLLLTGEGLAARPSAYARAKAKGRVYVHRPNYKRYRGAQRTRQATWFRLPTLRRASAAHRSRF